MVPGFLGQGPPACPSHNAVNVGRGMSRSACTTDACCFTEGVPIAIQSLMVLPVLGNPAGRADMHGLPAAALGPVEVKLNSTGQAVCCGKRTSGAESRLSGVVLAAVNPDSDEATCAACNTWGNVQHERSGLRPQAR